MVKTRGEWWWKENLKEEKRNEKKKEKKKKTLPETSRTNPSVTNGSNEVADFSCKKKKKMFAYVPVCLVTLCGDVS